MDMGTLIEIKNWIVGVVFGIFAVLTVVLPSQLAMIAGGKVTDFPQTPENFVPEVRVVAFSDSHNRNDNVAAAVDTAYELFDNDETYAGVDGFFAEFFHVLNIITAFYGKRMIRRQSC